MKWILAIVAALVLCTAIVLVRRGPADEKPSTPPRSVDAASEAEVIPAGPILTAGAVPTPGGHSTEKAAPPEAEVSEEVPKPTGEVQTWRPVESGGEAAPGKTATGKKQRVGPEGRVLKPGETFTPLAELKAPSAEELAAHRARIIAKLESVRPLRATWNDVPLQEVLQELSKESELVIALGVRALKRGMKIRVSDPFSGRDPAPDPTVWNIVQALAAEHGFTAVPWEKGVTLTQAPDPEAVRLRYYDAKDLAQAEWGNQPSTEAEDRLNTVLGEMIRVAAKLDPESLVQMRHGIVIVRQTNAALARIDEAMNAWRTDPKKLKADYKQFLSTRHPTVSGAPPREGDETKPPTKK